MISFNEACNHIKNNIRTSSKNQIIEIEQSCERIISKDYRSNYHIPFTNLSSMDGIVVNKKSLLKNKQYELLVNQNRG